jgi:hypothetical protein
MPAAEEQFAAAGILLPASSVLPDQSKLQVNANRITTPATSYSKGIIYPFSIQSPGSYIFYQITGRLLLIACFT